MYVRLDDQSLKPEPVDGISEEPNTAAIGLIIDSPVDLG
jgi:hypothetical protein